MARLDDIANYYADHDTSAEMGAGHWETGRAEPDPMVTTSLRLPKSVLDQVRERAETEGMKATAWMRAVVEDKVAAAGDTTEARLRRLESVVFSESA